MLIKKIIYEQHCNALRKPTNIVNDPSLFLHGSIDNNDFLEETLSGKNTTHVTAMILYQEQSTRSKNQVQLVRKQEVVNINNESLSSQPLEHFIVTNNKPLYVNYADINVLDVTTTHYIELIWILSKLKFDEDDNILRSNENVVPSWSPFSQMLSMILILFPRLGFASCYHMHQLHTMLYLQR